MCFFSVNEIRMIKGLNPSSLTRLHTLELRGNKLTSTEGLNLPNLKNLFLVSFGMFIMQHLTIPESMWFSIHIRFILTSFSHQGMTFDIIYLNALWAGRQKE